MLNLAEKYYNAPGLQQKVLAVGQQGSE